MLLDLGKNIKAELKKMVESASSGDVLVFHFSGHGTQVPSEEVDALFWPCDLPWTPYNACILWDVDAA